MRKGIRAIKRQAGLVLVELMVTMAVSAIVITALGASAAANARLIDSNAIGRPSVGKAFC